MTARRRGEQDGVAAGLEALAFGVLVLVLGTLVVVSGWRVVDAKFATAAAAREAVRAAVEAPPGAGADGMAARAHAAAAQALVGHGRERDGLVVVSERELRQERCATVRLTVGVPVTLPWVGGVRSLEVSSTAQGRVDPFRGGLGPTDGTCT